MTANKSRARAPDRYPSLARDWLDAAIDADLSQNELRIFLVIFRQTLCYSRARSVEIIFLFISSCQPFNSAS